MTLNNFLEAVAEKLVGLWPDRHVFVNEIPKDSDGNFFVGIIEATQEKKLDRRRRRHVQIEVLYFLASKDNLDFNEWSEKMLDEFESLTVVETESRSRLVRLTNVTARKDDDSRVYQFLFDADFYFVITPEVLSGPGQHNQIGGNRIMATKKKADSVDQAEPTFSKEQLVKSETLGLPRDAVAAILKDGQQYTREQAIQLVTEFLERKV